MPTSHLLDLASVRLSGEAIAANDEFFAPKENLLNPAAPVFIADKYTDRGKWMDGWETRRRRTPGHDWCMVRLGVPGVIRTLVVDTAFFRGNFPSHCWVEACGLAPGASATDADVQWHPILDRSELGGDMQNTFAIGDRRRFTHVRLNIFPDGGVARLRVLGEPLPDWTRVLAAGEIDLASRVLGGHVVDTSDRFFGEPQNMLMPYPAANMGDGWETKRRRSLGNDWAAVRLAAESVITRVEVATTHYKGNYPESCAVEALAVVEDGGVSADVATQVGGHWAEAVPRTPLQPDQQHVFPVQAVPMTATHVRLNIYPDGGISRFRVFGVPTPRARVSAVLHLLNAADGPDLRGLLANICAAPGWIDGMAAARPYANAAAVLAASDAASATVADADWLEAFKHHPRIGGQRAERSQSAAAEEWSAREQAGIVSAPPDVAAALAEGNAAYERRFGFVFIVCAKGRSAGEMLAELQRRLTNDPATELRVATGEQQRIMRLRLEQLLG